MVKRAGLLVALTLALAACGSTSHATPRSSHPKPRVWPFITSQRNGVGCELDLDLPHTTTPTEAFCENAARSVTLYPSGRVNISCDGCLGNGAGAPKLYPGKSVSLGPFRCTAVGTSVRCVVTATGRGFQIAGGRTMPKRIGA